MIETIVAPNPGPFTLDGTRTYVVDGRVVIDPGPAIERHLDAVLAAAPQLEAIVVTHRHADHAPGAAELRARTGAKLIAPAGVLGATDHELTHDERLSFDSFFLDAIASPGHTAEHFCFLTADRDLFTGDTVLGEGTTVIFPPDGHMGSYLATLRKLRDLNPRTIYPGHGPARQDAIALLDEYIEHRLMRERQIVAALAGGAASPSELRGAIYAALDSRLHRAAELQIESHLVHLEEEGVVTRQGDAFALRNG